MATSSGVNKKVIFLSVIFLIPFIVWFGQMTHRDNQKEDGTLYIGMEMPFFGLDVLGASGLLVPDMTIMNNLILERLFALGPTGEIIPVLGMSATSSEGGKAWDIELRQEVVFHDETPFNADAVVHHWKRILDPENKFRGRPFFEPVIGVEKVDDYKVRFILEHPWGAFLNVISGETHSFAYIPSPTAVTKGSHNEKPVGTGPFKFEKWNKGDHFSVAKNESYWQEGKPYLERIVFRQIPDPQTRYSALASYQVDAITVDRGTIIQKAMKDESFNVFPSQGSGAEIVFINTTKPPFDDVRVRRALALANDQNLHVKMVYQDSIPVVRHPFGQWVSCPGNNYPDHNLEKARQLISDYGRPVKIECLHSPTLRGRNTGELLQQLFRKIGVELTPVGINQGIQMMKVLEKDYQLATWRILSSRDHGPGLFRSFHSQSPANFTGYRSVKMDSLLEAQRREQDPDKRKEILCDIAELLNQDVPFFYRGGRRFHIISSQKVMDIRSSGEMVDLSLVWIKGRKDNPFGGRNEQAAKTIDCPDPGDTDAVKAIIIGAWKGKDSYGGTLKLNFIEDDIVSGTRNGGNEVTGKYIICGKKIILRMKTGTLVTITVSSDELKGNFKRGGYSGTLTMERDKTAS